MLTINRDGKIVICIHDEEQIKALREIIKAGNAALSDAWNPEPTIVDKVAKVFLDNLK